MRNVLLLFALTVMLSLGVMALEVENVNSNVNSRAFDSIDRAIDQSLKKGDKIEAIRLSNEKGRMLYYKGLYANALMILDNAIKLSDSGSDTIKHPEIKELYMESLNVKSVVLSYISKYEDAISCCIEMDKYNKGNALLYKTKFYNGMGVVFSMNGKLEQAAVYYRQALAVANKLEDKSDMNSQLFYIHSNLGGVYVQSSIFDSAQIHLAEAQKLAVLMQDVKKEIVCLQFMGVMSKNMGRYELAINYYDEAYKLATESEYYYIMPFLKLDMSLCYFQTKNYPLAFTVASEALDIARRSKTKIIEMLILSSMSRIQKKLGSVDKALEYLEASNMIRDSLFSQDNEEKFLRQKTDFDMYRASVEKEMLEKNAELKNKSRMINNLTVSIIILILVVMSAFLTYRLTKQQKINAAISKNHDSDIVSFRDEKRQLQEEIDKKNKELSLTELSIQKKSEMTAELMSKLKILKTNFPIRSKGLDVIREAEELVVQISRDDNNLDGFNYYLEQVTSEFYDRLDVLYPELTPSDRKICALMSFGLSTKDIANITGKTRGAIDVIKFRIRKKVNVETDENLCDFFLHLRA